MAKSNIYPKEYIKADGRKLIGGGPRDLQRRQQTVFMPDTSYIEDLKKQIDDLRSELKKNQNLNKPEGYFSAEEVDEEIRKAVAQAVAESALEFKKNKALANQTVEPLVQKYKVQIVELQKNNDDLKRLHATMAGQNKNLEEKISRLRSELKDVEELKREIAILEQKLVGKEEVITALKSRPAIVDDEIIEPGRPQIEKVFIDPLEKDAGDGLESHIDIKEITKEEKVDERVNKLRDLIGNKLPGGLK